MLPKQSINERAKQRRRQSLRRDQIGPDSRAALDRAISEINDPEVSAALAEVAHVLTGDDRFEQ